MKLIAITAIEEYEEALSALLQESKVSAFSSTEVLGHGTAKSASLEDNWFGGRSNNNSSVLFFAFVSEEAAAAVFKAIDTFNQQQTTQSKVHIALLNIEKSN
jgi:nitrogen regulatory protein PII